MEIGIVLLIIFGLIFFLFRRGGSGMGCCGGHSHGDFQKPTEEKKG